jgi:hypothetical protein
MEVTSLSHVERQRLPSDLGNSIDEERTAPPSISIISRPFLFRCMHTLRDV